MHDFQKILEQMPQGWCPITVLFCHMAGGPAKAAAVLNKLVGRKVTDVDVCQWRNRKWRSAPPYILDYMRSYLLLAYNPQGWSYLSLLLDLPDVDESLLGMDLL